jgi:tetratricopeptide (TPR) repeat protein
VQCGNRDLLELSSEELKAFAVSSDRSKLQEKFEQIEAEIGRAHLYAGQPRNPQSARCVSLARVGHQLAIHSGDDRFLLDSWRMLARCLTANEDYEEAVSFYEKLIERLESLGEGGQAARSRLGYIVALSHAGRHREALNIAQIAESWFLQNNDEIGCARLYTNIAILHGRLDEPAEAYRCHLKAIETFEKIGDRQALAQSYLNLGNLLASVDKFEESDEMYVRSEELGRELGLVDLSAQADYNRAYLHFLRGRYTGALQSFSRLRQHFRESGSERHLALCDLDEAEIYLQLNLSKDAADLATRAAAKFKEIGMASEEAKATAFYGMSLVQCGRFPEALDVFREAQKIYEQESNLYWIGLLDLYRAEVDFSLARFSEAQTVASRAKSLLERAGVPSKHILSLVLLGQRRLHARNRLAYW